MAEILARVFRDSEALHGTLQFCRITILTLDLIFFILTHPQQSIVSSLKIPEHENESDPSILYTTIPELPEIEYQGIPISCLTFAYVLFMRNYTS